MCFGFGMILGPTAGGAMFEVGGFSLPFGVLGGFLLLQVFINFTFFKTILTILVHPQYK